MLNPRGLSYLPSAAPLLQAFIRLIPPRTLRGQEVVQTFWAAMQRGPTVIPAAFGLRYCCGSRVLWERSAPGASASIPRSAPDGRCC